MNIQQFFDTFDGLWVETNRSSDITTNDQCVDLWRAYNMKVVGGPFMFGNAVDFWTNYPVDFYDKIGNTPDGVPKLGDVIIWGTKYSKYGHIAVCTDITDRLGFTSFDQNDPTGEPCHYQPHKYTGVLGWLRPKKEVVGHPDENVALRVVTEAYGGLPDSDPLKQGNLEGYTRAIVGEHLSFKENQDKAKILDGFVSKWVPVFNLSADSGLVEIEIEMSKLLPFEDTVNKLRNAIEEVVGLQVTDEALLEALHAVKTDITTLNGKLTACQLKLKKNGARWAFEVGPFTIKIYRYES